MPHSKGLWVLGRGLACLLVIHLPAGALLADELEKAEIKKQTRIIRENPADAEVFLQRGELYRQDSEYRLALQDFNRAEQLNPDLPKIDFARARVYDQINRHERTEKHLKRFLEFEPENRKALRLLVNCYIERGRFREADRIYESIIQTFSVPPLNFYFLKSQNRELYGDLPGALAVIEDAIRVAEWTPMLENKAIEYEIKLGEHPLALKRLNGLIDRDKKRQFRYYQKKAEIFLLLDDEASAKKNFNLALNSLDERHPTRTHLPGLQALRDHLLESIDSLN